MIYPLSQDYVREIFYYEPDTGKLFWTVDRGVRARAWDEAVGSLKKNGRKSVGVDRRIYDMDKVIWLYEHGRWPLKVIHMNRDNSDNRLCNLKGICE